MAPTLAERLFTTLQQQLHAGHWLPGQRLPSIRQLAQQEGISTYTVADVYDRLVAASLIEARRGEGFFACHANQHGAHSALPPPRLDAFWLIDSRFHPDSDAAQPGSGWLPDSWYDQDALHKALRQLARQPLQLGYGETAGWLPLRQQLASQLQEQGIPAQADTLLLTQGASQALSLIVLALISPGQKVLVDEPGYTNLLGLLHQVGAEVIGVPWTAEGPDCQALAKLLAQHQPKAFFTNSRLHNPSGASYSQACAHRVLQLAEQYDCWLIEDDVAAALAPPGSPTLAALDQLQRVIYLSSLSKSLAPGLRLGYLCAHPALYAALLQSKLNLSLTSSTLNEQLASLLLADGRQRHRLTQLRERLLAANLHARQGFQRLGWRLFAEPAASCFVWVELPAHLGDALSLCEDALQQGWLLTPGTLFYPQRRPSRWLRFNVAYCDTALFEYLARYAP